jgi:hypothetical protein
VTTVTGIQGIPPGYQAGNTSHTYSHQVIQKGPTYTTDSFYQNSLTKNQGITNIPVGGRQQILDK